MTAADAEILLPPLREANLRRILLASIIGPLANIAHIVVFSLDLGKGTAVEFQWRQGIIASHAVLLAAFLLLGGISWWLRSHARGGGAGARWVGHAFYATVLLVGVVIALIDQAVTSAITPYLFVSIVVPLVVQLSPAGPIVYHSVAFLGFAALLNVAQADPNVRLSNQVNGLTGLGIGIFLNLLLWRFNRDHLLQERRLEEQARELREANQTRDRFFSILAHDLRSPFAGFMGMLSVLIDQEHAVTQQERTEALRSLHQSSVALYKLLENLLAWSKAQQNLIEVRPEAVDLPALLEAVRQPLESAIQERRLTVVIDSVVSSASTDPQLLETVLRNLLSNAVKFTPPGGRVELRVRPAAEPPGWLEFECLDTGVGIPEETLGGLFRLDRPGGLGLILCRDFVGRLGGELRVESRPGHTRFWFRLPQDGVQGLTKAAIPPQNRLGKGDRAP